MIHCFRSEEKNLRERIAVLGVSRIQLVPTSFPHSPRSLTQMNNAAFSCVAGGMHKESDNLEVLES
jgi:flavorubredoxin